MLGADCATMGFDDVAADRKPETRAAPLAVAGTVHPVQALESSYAALSRFPDPLLCVD